MRRLYTLFLLVVGASLIALSFSFSPPANAGAQRTFVSTGGVDNPSCSLASPCRTFGAAIGATNPNGEVIVLNSGGYGPVTITQSVSIVSPAGLYAGVSVPTGDGITINAGAGDIIVLRGLVINSTGGTNGIHVQSAWRVNIEGVQISNFWAGGTGAGIVVDDSAAPNTVSIRNVAIRNGGDGVRILADTHYRQFDVDGLVVTDGNNGLIAQGNISGSIRNGSFAYLSVNAVRLTTNAGLQYPSITLERARIQNTDTAVLAQSTAASSGSNVAIADSVIENCAYPLKLVESGGGIATLYAARTTLHTFYQRAIDATVVGSGSTNVTVVDSLISNGGTRAISVDVGPGGYGNLTVTSTSVRNSGGPALYTRAGAGGFVSADLQQNLFSNNNTGLVADSNSVIRLNGNTVVNTYPGAGLVVQGSGSGMESMNNNMVRGSNGVDATPTIVAPK